ncbi:methyl-accepting chemotaxis protein [Thiomicrospira microaerophila]|uniref:methyl-accepting chemotaxis protein n=1 Tax=Thiomicrospira microaerophila TaxID=406020 RepID=UPI0006963FFE|nr:methyl-accepting chemotaxis protein [Thiomicrospira microaerophila]
MSRKIVIPAHYILYSTTDTHGTVLSASKDFLDISGYQHDELIGQPHNKIRHPSVPKQVFADMWATLKSGKSWTAIVVNRAKSGEEYWVRANVSPILDNERIVGYFSGRTPATDQEIQAAQTLYQQIEKGERVLKNGLARHPWDIKLDAYRNMSFLKKMMIPILSLMLLVGGIVGERLMHMKNQSLFAAGEGSAQDMITMAKNSRQFYMDEIVPKVIQAGMQLSHEYATHPTHLPLAANVMLALGEMSRQSGSERDVGEVKLFSAFPFTFRGQAQLDAFERAALAALEADPNTPYIRIEQSGGRSFYRMAVPDFMTSQACLNCHNHDPSSTKTDWQIGDVRGAISARIPLGELETAIAQPVAQLSAALVFAVMVMLGVILLLVSGLRKRVNYLQQGMTYAKKTGDITVRLHDKANDEIGELVNGLNSMQNDFLASISQVSSGVKALSEGDFNQQIIGGKGTFKLLQDAVNDTTRSLRMTVEDISRLMQGLNEGNLAVRVDERGQGEFKLITQNAMTAMQNLEHMISDVVQVVAQLEIGRFQYRMEGEARGDLLKLKQGLNTSMDALENAMKDITRIVVAQSEGDLTQRITAEYHGGLRILKEAINNSADKLIEVVAQSIDASNVVSTAANQVSAGAQGLSQRVQEQAAALEQTSATMDEMNSVVQSNTQNALQTAQVAKEVQTKAHQGAAVMQQTIEAMNSIQESSHKIADIVTLIDGIAFQTNLLALNAAVEAARAGEHGRGFAVVAGEVRALAQKSADAAKDIKGLISESVGRIDQGTKLASESGEVLQGINQAINGVAEMINQIAQASGEQADGIKQVHNAIAQIDGVTQQNAALVEETSAASESLSEQASILQQDMAFFKTGKAASTAAVRQSSPKPAPKTLAKPAAQAGAKSGLPTAPARRPQATAGDTKGNSNEWSEF